MSSNTEHVKHHIRNLESQLESAKAHLADIEKMEARQDSCSHKYPKIHNISLHGITYKCSNCLKEGL